MNQRLVLLGEPAKHIADTRQEEKIEYQDIVYSMNSDEKEVYHEHIDYIAAKPDIMTLGHHVTHYISFHNKMTNEVMQMKRMHKNQWRIESFQPGYNFLGWLRYRNCNT
ncbi:MAG: hypothetical protein D9C04_03900, partial [Nitrosopumilus sp. B06]